MVALGGGAVSYERGTPVLFTIVSFEPLILLFNLFIDLR